MKLQIYCVMCGEKEIEINVHLVSEINPVYVAKEIEKHTGWVVQFNGDNFDPYCCEECAK